MSAHQPQTSLFRSPVLPLLLLPLLLMPPLLDCLVVVSHAWHVSRWLYGARKSTSPFVTFWYCSLSPVLDTQNNPAAFQALLGKFTSSTSESPTKGRKGGGRSKGQSGGCCLAKSPEELPDWARNEDGMTTHRWNTF